MLWCRREKYNLPQNHHFRYLQIRSFITSIIKLHPNGFSLSAVEEAIQIPGSRKRMGFSNNVCTAHVRALWDATFVEAISDDEWDSVLSSSTGYLFTNKARELQFKVVHML